MPQPGAQLAMPSVFAVTGHASIVLFIPIFTHESEVTTDEHGCRDLAHVDDGGLVAMILSAASYSHIESLRKPLNLPRVSIS